MAPPPRGRPPLSSLAMVVPRLGAEGLRVGQLATFTAPDLLILDDVGLRPLEGEEPIDLYEVIKALYERGSMIVTSNRTLEDWYPLFLDDLIASAAMGPPVAPRPRGRDGRPLLPQPAGRQARRLRRLGPIADVSQHPISLVEPGGPAPKGGSAWPSWRAVFPATPSTPCQPLQARFANHVTRLFQPLEGGSIWPSQGWLNIAEP